MPDSRKPAEGNTPAKPARAGGIQVIARAASILRAVADEPRGLSLGQMSRKLDLPRSTVQRIIAALAREGLVAPAGPAGGVKIGPGLAQLAASIGASPAAAIAPYLRELGEEVGETVDLAVLSGGSVVFVDQVQGRHRLVALSAVGERFPLHCTANGKAVLACFSEADADDLIGKSEAEHPGHPLADRNRLLAEIAEARESHLAFDMAEHGSGICAVGTALLDAYGRTVAVSIPVPQQRFAASRDDLTEKLLAFRDTIRPVLGR